jgi:hypothetical protein
MVPPLQAAPYPPLYQNGLMLMIFNSIFSIKIISIIPLLNSAMFDILTKEQLGGAKNEVPDCHQLRTDE